MARGLPLTSLPAARPVRSVLRVDGLSPTCVVGAIMLLSAMVESGKHASLPLALSAVLACGTLQLIFAFVITFTTL